MEDNINGMMKVSLDGNYLSNPDLLPFLIKLKNSNVKADIKLSQEQFIESNTLLKGLSDAELINKIKIRSADLTDSDFIHKLPEFSNSVMLIE